jgi:carbon monoxide dehydrogenase subunit G
MKLEGDYLFDAPVQEVWNALFDPVVLAAVMPGCEKLERVGTRYVGELNIKVGPISGKFVGKVDLEDKVEPSSYRMVVDGRGAPGFLKATATVTLAPEGLGTRIAYSADAQVGGKIASVGQRLIDASARAIVKQSLEGLNANIVARMAAYRAAAAKAPAPAAVEAAAPAEAAAPKVVEFTPIKTRQSAIANAVAKEVASTIFTRGVLVAIIAIQFAVILWLALR